MQYTQTAAMPCPDGGSGAIRFGDGGPLPKSRILAISVIDELDDYIEYWVYPIAVKNPGKT